MAILITKESKIIVQGFTGKIGTFHAESIRTNNVCNRVKYLRKLFIHMHTHTVFNHWA